MSTLDYFETLGAKCINEFVKAVLKECTFVEINSRRDFGPFLTEDGARKESFELECKFYSKKKTDDFIITSIFL